MVKKHAHVYERVAQVNDGLGSLSEKIAKIAGRVQRNQGEKGKGTSIKKSTGGVTGIDHVSLKKKIQN